MAITNGYATLDEYKNYIAVRGLSGAVGDDVSDDSVIEDLIEAVSRFIDRQSGERFYVDSSDTVYYYTAQEGYEMRLPSFASITTVAVDYNNTRTYTNLTASDWEALPDNYLAEGKSINGLAILPTSSAYFPTWRRGIKVTGKRGWSAVPPDIKDACLSAVQNIYSNRSGQVSSGRINVTASGIVVRPEDVPPMAMATIKSYRGKT